MSEVHEYRASSTFTLIDDELCEVLLRFFRRSLLWQGAANSCAVRADVFVLLNPVSRIHVRTTSAHLIAEDYPNSLQND